MAIQKIEVSEYQCDFCKYKWINRVNGKDGEVPQRCAKCKRKYWNGYSGYNPITSEERRFRARLVRFEGYTKRPEDNLGHTYYYPNELCKKFFNIKPRPTIKELAEALQPLGYNPHKHPEFITNEAKPGYLKFDPKEYNKITKHETQKRRELMQQIIDSRVS